MVASTTVVIGSAQGLHARPASLLTQSVAKSGAKVLLRAGDGAEANASSLLSVLTLGAKQGDSVEVLVDGEDEDILLDQLCELLARDHDA